MSDIEDSPSAKRYKSEATSDLEVSPILTDSYEDKSVKFIKKTINENRNFIFLFSSVPDTKVFFLKSSFFFLIQKSYPFLIL